MVVQNQRRWDGSGEAGLKKVRL